MYYILYTYNTCIHELTDFTVESYTVICVDTGEIICMSHLHLQNDHSHVFPSR